MGAWFNSRPFAYVTPEFRKWWKEYAPEVQQKLFAKPVGVPWTHWEVQYPEQYPTMQPGKLWWPTGAGRFGVYFGVADHATVEAWRDDTLGGDANQLQNMGGEFLLSDQLESTDYIAKTMYMLPPRPITFSYGDAPTYLVTLVDQRYFWWQKDSGDLAKEPITSWSSLFEFFRDKLAIPQEQWEFTKPDDKYGAPGEYLATASHVPLSVMMDAAAWSIGCRVVVDFDYEGTAGTVAIQPFDKALANVAASLQLQRLLAGGQFKMRGRFGVDARDSGYVIPEKVIVSFPRFKYDEITQEGRTSIEIETKDITGYDGYKTGGKAVIHDTSKAYPGGDTDSKLKELAKLVVRDYLDFEANSNVEATLYGLRYVYPCGLWDVVEYNEYIADDTEITDDEETGFMMRFAKEKTIATTRISKPPFSWRAFTLHHNVGGSSSSNPPRSYSWVVDCAAGTVTVGAPTPVPPLPPLPPNSSDVTTKPAPSTPTSTGGDFGVEGPGGGGPIVIEVGP